MQQAADLLGVSATTMRRWAAGRITCQRTPSGQRRFRRATSKLVREQHVQALPTV